MNLLNIHDDSVRGHSYATIVKARCGRLSIAQFSAVSLTLCFLPTIVTTEMYNSSFALQPSSSPYQENVMESTGSLPGRSPSFSEPHPQSYRHTLALPPRTSSLMATIGYHNLDSYTQKALGLEYPEPTEALMEVQNEKNCRWTRLKRKMGRPLSSRSTSSVHSLKPLPPISETESDKYSIRVAYTPSPVTEDAPIQAWDNYEYTKQLNEAVSCVRNDFVSSAREIADSALSALSSLIVAAAATPQTRYELWYMTVSAAKELCNARPSTKTAVTSCLVRALYEVMKLWDALDEKRNKAPDDLAAMARRQIVRILEKRKEAGMRLNDNFTERLRAYCRQVLPSDPPYSLIH